MRLLFNLVLLTLAAAPPALAQAPEPPSRVGQISYVSGNLAFHAAGDTQWSAAGVNYPVATGDSFLTDLQARAQIQIGSTTIGMAGGTELDVTNLNDQVSQFGVPQGRINLHLRQLDNGQSFEVDLPQGSVWLLQPGSYDIDAATADQPARVAVFAGSARFIGGGADIGVNRGDAAVLTGANPVVARIEHASPAPFVEWCAARDYHAEGLAAAHYVSPQMTGYADLDQYGGWQGNPQYGEVWYPSQVPADWAPYRDGRWIWVQPGAGLGSTSNPGASRHFIMAAGPMWTTDGAGSPAATWRSRSMRRPLSPLSAPSRELALPQVADRLSAGFRSPPAKPIGRVIPTTCTTFATSTLPMLRISIIL